MARISDALPKAQENHPPATTLDNDLEVIKYLGSYIQNISWQEKKSHGILVTNCHTCGSLTSQKMGKSASSVPVLKVFYYTDVKDGPYTKNWSRGLLEHIPFSL